MKLYLSSYECHDFKMPRRVLRYQRTKLNGRNILIIEVDKPLIGQKYGFSGDSISKFYLANRVDENAFKKMDHFPIDVHVLIPKNTNNLNPSSSSQLQNIAWACLYDNEKDATNHKIK